LKKSKIRIQVAVLAFILLPATVGIVAVHASATCERFVHTYVTKPVRNAVSKETASAWEKWRIAHPNWKPNPNNHRPKYVMNREEAVDKVQFSCAVDLVPADAEIHFVPANLDVPPPVIDLHPMDTTQISFPELTPPEVAENTPPIPLLPIVPVDFPGTPEGPIPEPASLVLVGTGFGFLCLMLAALNRKALGSAAAPTEL
jgi:hypothetical protein